MSRSLGIWLGCLAWLGLLVEPVLPSVSPHDQQAHPRVLLLQPRHKQVISLPSVAIEVEIQGLDVPAACIAEVWVNEIKAFEVRERSAAVSVTSFEPGFHQIQVALTDPNGSLLGINSSTTHFLFDPSPPERLEGLGHVPLEQGRVSVIIPSHDRFDGLLRSIESVKAQTYADVEVIVVNDASSDERYYGLLEDVMMIHLPYNLGRPGLVRNIGVGAASGEWVAFLDDDDVWMSDKIERQIEAAVKANVSMSCSDALAGNGTFDASNKYDWWLRDLHGPYAVRKAVEAMVAWGGPVDSGSALQEGHCAQELECLPSVWGREVVLRANFVITSSVLVAREALLRAGPFNAKTLGEDHDLWKQVLRSTDAAFVREPLVYWRTDGDDKITQRWQQ
mmetsp:Transcript_29497/g.74122  ORF Transcript_29497/g.74122 Transcript_29497/m.74122 type:complete len:392 (-) Transcript_29497:85-1260(-)